MIDSAELDRTRLNLVQFFGFFNYMINNLLQVNDLMRESSAEKLYSSEAIIFSYPSSWLLYFLFIVFHNSTTVIFNSKKYLIKIKIKMLINVEREIIKKKIKNLFR